MRPGFVAGVLLSAALLLGVALYFRMRTGTAPGPGVTPKATADMPRSPLEPASRAAGASPAASPAVAGHVLTPEERQAFVEARVERLEQMSLDNDPAALSEILAALASPDKEVREAAIDAAKELGDTNAIPALKSAAENTENVQEKIAFLEAMDFLSLPPMTFKSSPVKRTPEQVQAEERRRARRDARRQAQLEERRAARELSPTSSTTSAQPPP